MRSTQWIRTDPRGKLLVAFIVHVALVAVFFATEMGEGPWDAVRIEQYLYVFPVMLPVNGWVLRKRHRSLRWLLFYLVGVGLVPFLVALLARPGRPA